MSPQSPRQRRPGSVPWNSDSSSAATIKSVRPRKPEIRCFRFIDDVRSDSSYPKLTVATDRDFAKPRRWSLIEYPRVAPPDPILVVAEPS